MEGTRQWTARKAVEAADGDNAFFIIETLEAVPVGAISTHDCNRRTGTFKYGVAIQEKHRGNGYASEAIAMIVRYYFKELGYQKVTADVYRFNEESIRLHEKLGFQLEGRLRRMIYTGGAFYDQLVYGMTVEEFEALQPQNQTTKLAQG